MGSRLSTDMAYIAGFLDGDGCVMLQLKKRSDTKRGYRFMATICLYQDTRHDKPLEWMQKVLGIGYISRRNDGISELRINGFKQIRVLLTELKPYIRFKTKQVEAILKAFNILERGISKLSDNELLEIVELALVVQNENYSSHHKKTREDYLKALDLTP